MSDGSLSFATEIDVTGLENGLNEIEAKISGVTSSVKTQSEKINELLTNIPNVDIEFQTNAAQSLDTIDKAFQQIDQVVDANRSAIRSLKDEYDKLGTEGSFTANGGDDTADLEAQKQAIQENIQLREQIIEECTKQADALAQTEAQLKAEAATMNGTADTVEAQLAQMGAACQSHEAALDKLEAEYKSTTTAMANALQSGNDKEYAALKQKQTAINQDISSRKQQLAAVREQMAAMQQTTNTTKEESTATQESAEHHVSLRQRIRELKEEMAEYRMQFGDQTQAYRDMAAELGKLQDIQGDISTQGSILSNDNAQFAGMISGISGVSGAMTAATGAMALFGSENEHLATIMQKLQSLMAITMGLQQVSQTLNKDSAFMLSTINGLRTYFNKIIAAGTVSETANTAAETANTAARNANNAATGKGTANLAGNTAAQVTNTVAANAGTAANITLSGAFKMLGQAIKGIPVFGWIAAGITALVAVVSHFVDKAYEAADAAKALNEAMHESTLQISSTEISIDNYIRKIENFTGTADQEAELVKELNKRYGEQIGFCQTLAEWKEQLTTKGDDYCKSLEKQAEAEAKLKAYQEALTQQKEVYRLADAGEYTQSGKYGVTGNLMDMHGQVAWFAKDKEERTQEARDYVDEQVKAAEQAYLEAQKEYEDFQSQHQIGGFVNPEATKKETTKKETTKTFDTELAEIKKQAAEQKYYDALAKLQADGEAQVSDAQASASNTALQAELKKINDSTNKKVAAWQKQIEELAKIRQQADKETFMQQEGVTEADWLKSANGKKTTQEYVVEILTDTSMAETDQEVLAQIEDDAIAQRKAVQQRYNDELVEMYGSTDEKIELAKRQWLEKMAGLDGDYLAEAQRQMNAEIAGIRFDQFKLEIDWDNIFGDLSSKSLPQLQNALAQLQTYYAQTMDSLSVDQIKEIQTTINNLEKEISARNPLLAFHQSIKDIAASRDEFKEAVNAQAEAIRELTEAREEQAAAEEALAALEAAAGEDSSIKETTEYAAAEQRVAEAKNKVAEAQKSEQKAETELLNARNQLVNSLSSMNSTLKSCTSIVGGINEKIEGLADAFGKDLGDSIDKVLGMMDDCFDAADTVITNIGKLSGDVSDDIETTVENTANGVKVTANAGAQAIATIERASVILAIIQAALQVAMAIASLFNNDDDLQEDIDELNNRVEQLEWELDNLDAVNVMERFGSAVELVKNTFHEVFVEITGISGLFTNLISKSSSWWNSMVNNSESLEMIVEDLVAAYGSLDYAVTETMGSAKYDVSDELNNYAEQMALLEAEIQAEDDKKHTDYGQIDEWENEIEELAAEMASLKTDMMNELVGSSAEDLSATLTDAFVEACANGEDAMEAWGDTAKSVVTTVVKNMLSAQLEEKMASIYDEYMDKWYDDSGNFNADAVLDSMLDFADDITSLGEEFSVIYESMSEALQDYLEESSREADSGSIVSASQESVDETNARLTTIQGHTYSLVSGQQELNSHISAMHTILNNIYSCQTTITTVAGKTMSNVSAIYSIADAMNRNGVKLKS